MPLTRLLALFLSLTWTASPGLASRADVQLKAPAEQVLAHGSLVETIRTVTAPFRDVKNAVGYEEMLGCVSSPIEGAMGVHFINPSLVGDATLDPTRPEALIYEIKNGVPRLVGVEFIVLASVWHETHPPQEPPVLGGQLMQFENSPNRFGLPAFYQLHVWAWRDNPKGMFADFNPRVSCDRP